VTPAEHPAARVNILALVRRRRNVLVACAVLVPILAILYSLQQPKQYTASATLLFEPSQFAQGLFGTSATFTPTQQSDPTRAAATDVSLVQQSIIAQKAAGALHLTQGAVRAAVTITPEGQSDLVEVSATTRSGDLSMRLANSYANQFISYRRFEEQQQIFTAEQQIAQKLSTFHGAARNSGAGLDLATRQQDLQIFASLQTGDAQLYQPAQLPTSPSAPRPVRNAVIGIFAGLILGVALALLFERIDQRVRDVDELEALFGRPLLGAIPNSKSIASNPDALAGLGPQEAEAFRLLRTNLRYFNVDSDIRSVAVNSAAASEGKSTVALYLSVFAANGGRRVLLIEADMRRPVLKARLGLDGVVGLSDVLAGQSSFDEAVQPVALFDVAERVGQRRGSTLDVLTAGAPPPNPSDLIESARMEQVIEAARESYDLVVIDTPPSLVSDAIHLFRHVEGVIAVARLGVSRRDQTKEFVNRLERLRAPLLGVVVNGIRSVDGYAGYSYGYGRLDEFAPPAARTAPSRAPDADHGPASSEPSRR
jgi:polysaccharide biosynthesis transport protein